MRVILDCDTQNEIDDQLMIAYALGSAELDVLGVVSVHNTVASGPDSVDRYVEEAKRIVTLCGRPELPTLAGACGPMETPSAPARSEGLEFIVAEAQREPLTLLATGPITDVASLALVHPEFSDRVRVVWAGAFGDEATWNRYRLGELNARADIAAWRALYDSDFDLTILPGWPHIAHVSVDWRGYVQSLGELGTGLGDYLAEIMQRWCATWGGWGGAASSEAPRQKVLWDVVNVAYLRDPSWVAIEERPLPTLDAAGAPDYSRVSRRASVCVGVDHEAVLADLWSVLAGIRV